MNTPKLPPLPEKIFIPSGLGFTKDDMQAYAIAAIAAQGVPDGWLLCNVASRPLSYPLSDYHNAMQKG